MVLVRTEMETSSMNFPAVAVARCSKLRHTEIVRQPGSNAEFCSVPTEPKGAHSILGNLKTPSSEPKANTVYLWISATWECRDLCSALGNTTCLNILHSHEMEDKMNAMAMVRGCDMWEFLVGCKAIYINIYYSQPYTVPIYIYLQCPW